tara:strand:+ start:922 stop:1971 length:1050 start_codon:yes stop_codon:yes gene_type:complete
MIFDDPIFFLLLFSSFISTILAISSILFLKLFPNIQDIPNKRSLHEEAKPRIGGVIFMIIILIFWLVSDFIVLPIINTFYLSLVTISLMAISFLDDLKSISALVRIIFHFILVSFFILSINLDLNLLFLFCIIILMVWMINLFNFMDGSDGLAAGMAVIGFGSYFTASFLAGDFGFAIKNGIIAMCLLGFLFFNFPPAKVFMGDVGSISLGFLSGAIGIIGWEKEIWPIWFPLVIFSPFIVDSSVTLFKRILKREKFWQAHREHYYQRLILLGWSHKKTAIILYLVMILLSSISFYSMNNSANSCCEIFGINSLSAFLIIIFISYSLSVIYIDKKWKNFLENNKSTHQQ